MHGSECDIQIWWTEVENVSRGPIVNWWAQMEKKEFLYRVVRVWSNGNVFADRSLSVKTESSFVGKR